jgi:transcriptional regulator with XRE-family HTH domain
MGITPEPNYHGRQLIRELRKLRLRTGLTQQEGGDRAHIDLQKLSRLETRQLPTYHELCMLLDVYGVLSTEWAPYLDLWELARQPAWWRKFGVKDPRYLRMEDEAMLMYEFRLGYLPELLQTEDYARAMHTNTAELRNQKVIDNMVEVQLRRQDRLQAKEDRLTLYTLIHEPVLRQGVDHLQLLKLAEHAELPNITIQVVPQDTGLHDGLRSSMTLLTFADDEPDIAFSDTHAGLCETQDPSHVTLIKRAIDRVSSLALTPSKSLEFIKTMV